VVKLKVCGITTISDALTAVDCGATYLGFNFYQKSPRYITPEKTREIIGQLPPNVVTVGVFVNEPSPQDVVDILRISNTRIAQLHGDEPPEYCFRVGAERVIKALRIKENFDVKNLLNYQAYAILLDAFDVQLYGGTGKPANWAVAHEATKLTKVFLAGGLSPDNIAQAIKVVNPYAVDVNSGVESSPGRKDHKKLFKLKEQIERLG